MGWAIGPVGQMYLNGRLPGYRTAVVLMPESALVAVVLAGDDIAEAIESFAA